MAIYKDGNRYLSESEYQSERESNWKFILGFVGVAMGAGYLSSFVETISTSKSFYVAAVVVGAVIGGLILSRLYALIKVVAIGVALYVIVSSVGQLLWKTAPNHGVSKSPLKGVRLGP